MGGGGWGLLRPNRGDISKSKRRDFAVEAARFFAAIHLGHGRGEAVGRRVVEAHGLNKNDNKLYINMNNNNNNININNNNNNNNNKISIKISWAACC